MAALHSLKQLRTGAYHAIRGMDGVAMPGLRIGEHSLSPDKFQEILRLMAELRPQLPPQQREKPQGHASKQKRLERVTHPSARQEGSDQPFEQRFGRLRASPADLSWYLGSRRVHAA
jgi:hypothetical protein